MNKKIIIPAAISLLLLCSSIPAQVKEWRVIAIPAEEKGYGNFNTVVIATAGEWEKFLNEGADGEQMAWKHHEAFEATIAADGIDFWNESLVLVRDTESSRDHQVR